MLKCANQGTIWARGDTFIPCKYSGGGGLSSACQSVSSETRYKFWLHPTKPSFFHLTWNLHLTHTYPCTILDLMICTYKWDFTMLIFTLIEHEFWGSQAICSLNLSTQVQEQRHGHARNCYHVKVRSYIKITKKNKFYCIINRGD